MDGRGGISIARWPAGRPGSTVNRRDLGDERHIGQCIAQTGRYGARWYTMDSTTAGSNAMHDALSLDERRFRAGIARCYVHPRIFSIFWRRPSLR